MRRKPGPQLHIGPIEVDPPVVLAPMAGVTNAPFRRLARHHGAPPPADGSSVPGVYVCEMIGARALVNGDEKTRLLATFPDDENPRSIQLYGTDPEAVGEAVAMLVERLKSVQGSATGAAGSAGTRQLLISPGRNLAVMVRVRKGSVMVA